MNVLFTVLVTFFAGMGAGLGTGFAGMSAAAVISPMLITFLHQLIHIHGDEVRLDMPHLHDIPGRFIVRVVGKEQQDVQRRL